MAAEIANLKRKIKISEEYTNALKEQLATLEGRNEADDDISNACRRLFTQLAEDICGEEDDEILHLKPHPRFIMANLATKSRIRPIFRVEPDGTVYCPTSKRPRLNVLTDPEDTWVDKFLA